jgi:hypothetical protein
MPLAPYREFLTGQQAKFHSKAVATENLAEATGKIFTKVGFEIDLASRASFGFPLSQGGVPMAGLTKSSA